MPNEVCKPGKLFSCNNNQNLLHKQQTYVFRNAHSVARLGNRIAHLLTILAYFWWEPTISDKIGGPIGRKR